MFDRFYRLDSSRNSETGGFGIGLSIAKAIVQKHGGEIKALALTENAWYLDWISRFYLFLSGKIQVSIDFLWKISYIVNWQYDMYKLSKTVEIYRF